MAGCSIRPREGTARSFQGGLALITTLVILVIVTLLGTSTVRVSLLKEKMAANAMYYNSAFQTSESAVAGALADNALLSQAIDTGSASQTVDLSDTSLDGSAQVTYLGAGPAPGFSIGVNKGSFVSYLFDVTGTGRLPAVGVESVTSQGAQRIAPKSDQ